MLLEFINTLAAHYDAMKEEVERDEYNDVSLCYWEKDGLAMIAEFCTGDGFFEQKTDDLYSLMEKLNLILGDGNDNDAGYILTNDIESDPLDVNTRMVLSNFIQGCNWIFNDAEYLEDFSESEKEILRENLNRV